MSKLQPTDAQARLLNPVGKDFSEALARGLRVIEAFDSPSQALTLTDIARTVHLPRATVRRALLTLVHLGYVEEQGRAFRLTARVLTLAGAYLGSSIATSVLQPVCERLSAEHNETFSVAALDGSHAVMVAYARPRSMYQLGGGVGLRIPAHCTAVGRVLVAAMAEDERTAFVANNTMEAPTASTITDRAVLARLIAEVAAQGFAIVEDEAEIGFRSLAVPVWRRDGRLGFALNVGMPTSRGSRSEARVRFISVLKAEAERLGPLLL